ncbi:MAG: amidohydrolase family protein [Actinobacteria bacterium]|nr:amidohydrolase family protein [Actinomycetota bacterium]
MDVGRIRRPDHERRRARGDRAPRGARRLAGWGARDRRPRESRGARRARGDEGRMGATGPAAADRARAMPGARGPHALCGTRRRLLGAVLHAPSDRDLAERFWPDRLDGSYAFRSLGTSGAVLANGSDAPIEELDPLAGIRAAVTRTIDERPGWRMEQALTVEEALHASTVAPAWLAGDERTRGKLVPGYLADLVVLSRDPVECPPDELESVEVVATMVGGRWAHNPPPW